MQSRWRRRKPGRTHSPVYWLVIHAHQYVHKHKYSDVHIYTGLADGPLASPAAPTLGPRGLHLRVKVCRGLALEGGSPEEGEVLLPSPRRHLQRVLSLLNGTTGQEAQRHALCCGPGPRRRL